MTTNLPQIDQLTLEQEALIPGYLNKWRKIALATELINQEQAANSVKAAYAAIGKAEPRIIFCDNSFLGLVPYTIWVGSDTPLARKLLDIFGEQLGDLYHFSQLEQQLYQQLENQISISLLGKLERQLNHPLLTLVEGLQVEGKLLEKQQREMARIAGGELLDSEQQLLNLLLVEESAEIINSQRQYEIDEDLLPDVTMWQIDGLSQFCILSKFWAAQASLFDFCRVVLNCEIQSETWAAYQAIAQHCDLIFPYEKVCLICDRL